jgi:hypothetical protein
MPQPWEETDEEFAQRTSEPKLPERKAPTHVLRIEVPINIEAASRETTRFDALQEAIKLTISLSRAAYVDVICDDINVEMLDAKQRIPPWVAVEREQH